MPPQRENQVVERAVGARRVIPWRVVGGGRVVAWDRRIGSPGGTSVAKTAGAARVSASAAEAAEADRASAPEAAEADRVSLPLGRNDRASKPVLVAL